MSRLVLLGIVAIALLVIAPLVGASSSISVTPNKGGSSLLARTVFDVAEEGINKEELLDNADERREENKRENRRDDNKEWADNEEE
ncbi:MAG: hypothetical protein DSM107014_08470 [Gomphosphaeria aponina SAG 52.96 = DSM 107014]|uniref:Uncharacterized protein n=1 Tax=Gomphosphaeria aponina SAG 52.96 = DSM 107014 TaxID=1521640 RepID=A0A941JT42_9CHRO|nr:hypothetical protein [Gomphosphaeria aponina SAG 52.96 = DSM 107014]